ncbi:MAG TPA: sulfotransferase domain-containing protein [Sporichthya sp.]|nr:sulfotransferase domain-containing protein [Sporichthya sp.]
MDTAVSRPATVRYRNLIFDSARWDGFAFRDGDIVLSTPPKSGTTWLQMICALLIFQRTELPARLDELSPWMDMQTRPVADVHARLAAQRHRRFIKTHTPLDGLPWDERVTYLCVGRDPRDVALSWDNHRSNLNFDEFFAARARAVGTDDLAELLPGGPPPPPPADPAERYWEFIEDSTPIGLAPAPSLATTMHHLSTFWAVLDRPNVALVHYADLQADLAGQMAALAGQLGIDVPAERWPGLVAAAGFEPMRARAADLVPESDWPAWLDTARFFHCGTSGRWRDLPGDPDGTRYTAAVEHLAAPEVLDWAHRGPSWRAN